MTGLSRLRAVATAPAVVLGVAAAALVGADLGARVFVTNDEARFGVLAQDIIARGDWLHPTIGGGIYYNKPLLLAWLIALASWPLGYVTQLTAVLPSALAAIATVLVVYAAGRDLFGADAAKAAGLVAMTCQGLLVHAHLPLPDMLMTACLGASLWMFVRMRRDPHGGAWLGFYGFAAAAFWTKGLAGLLPLAIGFIDAWLARRAAPPRAIAGLSGVGVSIAVWFAIGATTDASAVRNVVVVDQLLWYVPTAPSVALFAEPVRHGVSILFPWALLLPVAVPQAVRFLRGTGVERDRILFVLLWGGITFVAVALSHQQRVRYYVPLVPPAALLLGWWFRGATVRRRPIVLSWRVYAIAGAVLAAAVAAVGIAGRDWARDLAVYVPRSIVEALALIALAVIAVASILIALRHGTERPLLVGGAAVGLLLVLGDHGQITRWNEANDYPQLYRRIRPSLDERPIASWGVPYLPLTFYFERPVVPIDSDADLRRVVARADTLVLVTDKSLRRSVERDRLVTVARDRLGREAVALVRYDAGDRAPERERTGSQR